MKYLFSNLAILTGIWTALFFSCDKNPSQLNEPPDTIDNVSNIEIELPEQFHLIQQLPQFPDPQYSDYTVNILLMSGSDGNLLVDTGYQYASSITGDTIVQLTGNPIHFIINTHHHSDHLGGNSQVVGTGTVVGHEAALAIFQQWSHGAQIERVNGQKNINYNGDDIRCYTLSNGHSYSDIIIHFVNSKVLCLGDMFISEGFPSVVIEDGGSVQTMITNLDSILTFIPRDVVVIPGHGRIVTMTEFEDYVDMIKTTVEVVLDHMTQGKTAEQMIAEDILAPWSEWGRYHAGLTKAYWIRDIVDSYNPTPNTLDKD